MDEWAQGTNAGDIVFGFGKNWQSFVRAGIDERRTAPAVASLRRLLGVEDLGGRSFLDVGCGSGLGYLNTGVGHCSNEFTFRRPAAE